MWVLDGGLVSTGGRDKEETESLVEDTDLHMTWARCLPVHSEPIETESAMDVASGVKI
jgi:hypothetical protein